MRRVLHWAPRVLVILFIVFISLLSLDVFAEDYSLWETLWALFMHLIPTFILILATVVAWKWELTGGSIFIILGFLYVFMMSRSSFISFVDYSIVAGPLFLIGSLFLLDGFLKKGGD